MEDTATNIEEEISQEISSSQQPTVTNVSSGNTPPVESQKDEIPDDIDEDMTTNVDQNGGTDITNEADVSDIPENVSNVENHNMSERDGLPEVPNISNEKEQVDGTSDDDDDILNRSAFDINPLSPTTSLPADTNIAPNHEILENNNVQGDAAV